MYILSCIINYKQAIDLNIDTETKTVLEKNIEKYLCDFGLLKKKKKNQQTKDGVAWPQDNKAKT